MIRSGFSFSKCRGYRTQSIQFESETLVTDVFVSTILISYLYICGYSIDRKIMLNFE